MERTFPFGAGVLGFVFATLVAGLSGVLGAVYTEYRYDATISPLDSLVTVLRCSIPAYFWFGGSTALAR